MPIKTLVKKMGMGRGPEGIGAYRGDLTIASIAEVYGFGLANVMLRIDPGSFSDIAKAMIVANADEAIKAFGAAMQDGIGQKAP